MKQTITRYELEILEKLIAARIAVVEATARLMLAEPGHDYRSLLDIAEAVANGAALIDCLRDYEITVADPLVDESRQGGEELRAES